MIMNLKEKENITKIEAAKVWHDKAIILLGDREPEYRYYDRIKAHMWGFGDPTSKHSDRQHIFHRVGAPSMYSDDPSMAGGETWHAFHGLHRLDGPALSDITGRHEWWLYGVPLVSWRVYQLFTICSKEDLIFFILKEGVMKGDEWCDIEKFTLEEISAILAM